MSQSDKSRYFQALKAAGATFELHYREYTTEQLREAFDRLTPEQQAGGQQPAPPPQVQVPTPPAAPPLEDEPAPAGFFGYPEQGPEPDPVPTASTPSTPVRTKDPNEMAGQRLNELEHDQPLRIDPDTGVAWFAEEIRKPAFPKPRARRVLQYQDTGVETETIKRGEFIETFEVAGDGPPRTSEVKITMPSYQVGVYKDPRFPFKVHTYNGAEGFDLFEVQDYYHGAELVPAECKRIYVENVLCYDMRTVIRAIETEYRQLQLAGKVT